MKRQEALEDPRRRSLKWETQFGRHTFTLSPSRNTLASWQWFIRQAMLQVDKSYGDCGYGPSVGVSGQRSITHLERNKGGQGLLD